MASDVKVIIQVSKAAGKRGFGIPLILAGLEATAVPYTECGDLDAVKALFPEDTDVYKAANLLWMQQSAPAKIAVCGSTQTATMALDDVYERGWRQLIVTSVGKKTDDETPVAENTVKEIADYIETKQDKLYFASVQTLEELEPLTQYDRTVLLYHHGDGVKHPEAALVGATAGLNVGSFTYKNMILRGLQPMPLTDAEIDEAHLAGAMTFVQKAGDNVTSEGKTRSGEYIDVIDCKDYIIQNIAYNTQKALNRNPKLPYDNRGIALLESCVINVLQDAYNKGMIADRDDGTPDFQVHFATRAEVDPADRAARKYLGGTFSFGLAGAIHYVEIQGEIQI